MTDMADFIRAQAEQVRAFTALIGELRKYQVTRSAEVTLDIPLTDDDLTTLIAALTDLLDDLGLEPEIDTTRTGQQILLRVSIGAQ